MLNTISTCDSFVLLKSSLQAGRAAVWFTSFDLAQGYLQIAIEEANIPNTAFWIGTHGLSEFSWMPFGLINVGNLPIGFWRSAVCYFHILTR